MTSIIGQVKTQARCVFTLKYSIQSKSHITFTQFSPTLLFNLFFSLLFCLRDEVGAAALKTVELDAALEGHSFQYREVSGNNRLLLSMLFELHVAFCYWLGILNNGILSAGSVILRGISTTTDSIDQDRVIIVAPAELEALLLSHSEIFDVEVITFKYYKVVSELQQKKDGGMFINSFYLQCQTWISETCHARNTPRINNKSSGKLARVKVFTHKVTSSKPVRGLSPHFHVTATLLATWCHMAADVAMTRDRPYPNPNLT
ncbi:hypothetical protein Tco_1362897 [Tanacetum coccineum]